MSAPVEVCCYHDFQMPSPAAHLDARSVTIPSLRAGPARSGGGAVFAVVRTGCARTVARARACWRHRFPLTSLRSRCWCVQVGAASQGACSADRLDGSSAAGAHRRQQAAHHKLPRSLPRCTPKLGSGPGTPPARGGHAWCTWVCVIGVGDCAGLTYTHARTHTRTHARTHLHVRTYVSLSLSLSLNLSRYADACMCAIKLLIDPSPATHIYVGEWMVRVCACI